MDKSNDGGFLDKLLSTGTSLFTAWQSTEAAKATAKANKQTTVPAVPKATSTGLPSWALPTIIIVGVVALGAVLFKVLR